MNTLKNAMKSYHDMGIIESYSAGNLRMIGPSDTSRAKEKLDNYIDILEVLKEWPDEAFSVVFISGDLGSVPVRDPLTLEYFQHWYSQ